MKELLYVGVVSQGKSTDRKLKSQPVDVVNGCVCELVFFL